MDFNEKLQTLRKGKGLTQDELAEALYVSRAAVSKWESGRGYPNIDSLKSIARFFSVSIDELLSSDEVLSIAEEDSTKKKDCFRDLVFGCLDCSFALFFFLPLFGQTEGDIILDVSLPALTVIQPWLRGLYLLSVIASILLGMLTLALQNSENTVWLKVKSRLSLAFNAAVTFLFIFSRQPYAAAFSFVFLIIKGLILAKTQ